MSNRAAIVIAINPNQSQERQTAILTGLPALFASFGLSFTGSHLGQTTPKGRLFGALKGHLKPVKGDEDSNDPEIFPLLLEGFVAVMSESPLKICIIGIAAVAFTEGDDDPLDELHVGLLRRIVEEVEEVEEEEEDYA